MPWVAIAIGGSALVGAASSIYGSNQAADAAKKGAKNANAELARQYDTSRADLAPYRFVGTQALNSLGYAAGLTPYANPSYGYGDGSGSAITVNGRGGSGGATLQPPGTGGSFNPIDPAGVFGGSQGQRYGGTIDPVTGTVTVPGNPKDLNDALTQYLRTGQMPEGRKFGKDIQRVVSAIDQLRGSGWTYDPNAASQAQQSGTGQIGQFETSPGYEFLRSEGTRGIERTAAARGGLSSGNTLKALDQFNVGLAQQDYGNWWNRVAGLAGVGQTATTTTAQLGANSANNQAQNTMTSADARASSYLTNSATVNNTLNSALNNWMLYRGGWYGAPGAGSTGYSSQGPWAGGYVGVNLGD